MEDKKASDETAAGALDGTEIVRVVQGGSSVRTTAAAIGALGGFGYLAVTADATLPNANTIVDVDTSGLTAPDTLNLTLGTPAAGRVYIVRKVEGAEDETITVVPAGSEEIDTYAASRMLPGSNEPVYTPGYCNWPTWMITSDGTDWVTVMISQQVLHVRRSEYPDDYGLAEEPQGYLPGSTWCVTVQAPASIMMMNMGTDAGSADWERIDAVDVVEIAYADSPYVLPNRDRQIDVTTAGGVVVLEGIGAAGAQMVGVQYVVMKTNTGTNKITLDFDGVSTSVNGAAGVTTYDLPGSADADQGLWRITLRTGGVWVSGGSGLV